MTSPGREAQVKDKDETKDSAETTASANWMEHRTPKEVQATIDEAENGDDDDGEQI
jgi:hypothetical protein